MEIQLKQKHIEAALHDFITKAGITFDVDRIDFTAGRGKDGLTATVALEDPFTAMLDKVADAPEDKPEPRKKEAFSKQAKPEPEEEKEEPKPRTEPVAEDEDKAPPFSPEEDEPTPEVKEAPAKKTAGSLFG